MKYKRYAGTISYKWTFDLCCSTCGAAVQPHHKFCPECGRRLVARKGGLSEEELLEILNNADSTITVETIQDNKKGGITDGGKESK